MKLRSPVFAVAAVCFGGITSNAVSAQGAVPTRALSKPEATTLRRFGAVESVRPTSTGGILVNDSRFRQLLVVDSLLTTAAVTLDSTSGAPFHYAGLDAQLLHYVGDSSVIRDGASAYMLLVDPAGFVVDQLIKTKAGETPMRTPQPRGYDLEGNLYGVGLRIPDPRADRWAPRDLPIVRVNFATHREEPVAEFSVTPRAQMRSTTGTDGMRRVIRTINPLTLSDEFVVLSDGTVAVVRAADYRVEIFQPNGKRTSSTKLPFAKQRLSDADKQAEAQAARAAEHEREIETGSTNTQNRAFAAVTSIAALSPDSLKHAAQQSGGSFTLNVPDTAPSSEIEVVPNKSMLDYLPPFRAGAVMPDLDGRVWILAARSAAAASQESVYDVVSSRGEHVQRVRVPAGRTIAGFGRDGVVYLRFKDGPNSWGVERTRILN